MRDERDEKSPFNEREDRDYRYSSLSERERGMSSENARSVRGEREVTSFSH